ncbi:MAG TPA: hypothetical protein VK807_24205 [Gemmatimonadaceae bacterium]|nr:hypothetical protein [Gemmatimonadaceae bacterium]
MIVADVRRALRRDDAQLVLRLIARGNAIEYERAEGKLRDEGLDALLDDPRLLTGLLESRQGACASYPLFAYVLVRHAMQSVGESDRVLADYVASILLHFGLQQRANRVGESDDEYYDTVAGLLGAVDGPDAQRAFLVRAHLGNYALWLSGMFPEFIAGRHHRRGAPDLDYFEEVGRRGYQLAADHRLATEHGLATLYSAAAERFPLLRVALNRVSDRTLFANRYSPERLMRQVRDEARWKLVS